MELGVSNKVIARDDKGRFRAACSAAAARTIKEAIEEGAALSRANAPVGHKLDARTVPLKDSIVAVQDSRISGHWYSFARHALPVEFGSRAHEITGDVKFYWEYASRWWKPSDNIINLPGIDAQPFLRPAYDAVMSRILRIAKKHYPG